MMLTDGRIYLHSLSWWVYILRVIPQFPALSRDFVMKYIGGCGVALTLFVLVTSLLAQLHHWCCVFFLLGTIPCSSCSFSHLLVICLESWWCSQAPEGSSAMWQPQDILGGMWGCKVESLVDAWQLAGSTVTLLRLDTTTTANILLSYPPTPQMQKIEVKSRTLLSLFLCKRFIS